MSLLLTTTKHEPAKANTPVALRILPTIPQHLNLPSAERIDEIPVLPPLPETETGFLPHGRAIIVIASLAGVNFLSSVTNGLLTVGLPRMASDVGLPQHLLLWPSSVYSLTSGSCLLLAGSIADVVGNRYINLTGCLVVGCFMIACGLARTGIELIMFRAFQGIALSLCLPTSVAIVASAVPSGRKRNIGFACLGLVQCAGFSVGLVFAGVLLESIGWRIGFYLCGGLIFMLFVVSIWALPPDKVVEGAKLKRLQTEIDWIGATMACACLSLFSYILSTLTNSGSQIRDPANVIMLTLSVLLVPAFILWERRQERRQKPALIPNSLWRNTVFTSVCLMLMFSNALANAMEIFCSLFFQTVQNLSALQASLRILPSLLVGTLLNLSTGLLIDRLPVFAVVLVALILNAGAPLLMAVISPQWPYWYDAFFAQLLAPISADILFTVGLVVVSDVFPVETQALAGAVFNTVAQFGNSVGMTIMAVIAAEATKTSSVRDKASSEGLMVGYRASFWAAFAWMVLACLIGAFGLRKIGKVGLKRD